MPKISDYKAILFDVDKTLTNSNREISPRLAIALQKIHETGIQVGVCTGRHYASLKRTIMPLFDEGAYHVTSGGAQVITSVGQMIWQKTIPDPIAREITEAAEKFDCGYVICSGDVGYANPKMIAFYTNRNPLSPPLKPVAELQNFEATIIPVLQANDEFINYLDERDDITFKQMHAYQGFINLDVTARHVNKSVGLREWSRITGIDASQVIGVGDSENDDEFLQTVGYSVAMGNATPYLKSIAKRVIGHTDEGGLAVYLENLAEGAEL